MTVPESMMRTPKRAQSALSNASNGAGADFTDSRKRQSKKDEAIRRKIENDLRKRKNTNMTDLQGSPRNLRRRPGNYTPGTVMFLKPSEPIVCRPSYTVFEAAQLMSLKKENCILVVDEDEELLGIFTAKDLAFRIVGSNLNANTTMIEEIMTPNPMCCKTSTLASDALNLMVGRGFRHLPVINDSNQIVGVLDITKCYNEAMIKLERMYESSKKLYDAMEGVNAEMGGVSSQPAHVIKYFDNLKSLIDGPTLNSVLDDSTLPIYIDIRASVFDAANAMKDNHTTAVLVKDSQKFDEVTGIFTSKDVVLRVIAAGLDPRTCSVIRVMTPKPDYASGGLSVHQALRKMFDGHYLNLPVIDEDSSEIVGIVEVLKLTYATLNQLKSVQSFGGDSVSGSEIGSAAGANEREGPAWNKFWTSLDNETESLHSLDSDSQVNVQVQDVSRSEMAQFAINNDIGPSDSISVTGMEEKSPAKLRDPQAAKINFDEAYFFKFKSPVGRIHRISFKPSEGVVSLRDLVSSKFNKQEQLALQRSQHESFTENFDFAISYIDDEGDVVAITTDQDLLDCVLISKQLQREKADLYIHHPETTPDVDTLPSRRVAKSSVESKGLPNEVLLSGAIFALAAAVVVVFTFSRK
ncbi:unnamed protein product [Kuraishia capsulata CBS 1993]|uniref:CBS domain-containing protein n=1 Tax=Kuraishia capsulata CBS 1993 TaxID=1382522 RepID=W6MPI2_9ASCO|nr:uncharacterized protein KUCA_T00004598001 [Kuraishia capsulata CBS 1993]CDK28614.1 unnamed protein product [Kuraishia capsulata CBS 1993]